MSKFHKVKKSQAAIEFLMTYGWMLLVVLIVGALIFSFVDFGSLLPNQLDLNAPLRGDSGLISATSSSSEVQFVISYVGSRSSTINANEAKLTPDLNYECNDVLFEKVDTEQQVSNGGSDSDILQVINGDLVKVIFTCDDNNLIANDVFEGEAFFKIKDSRTGFEVTSRGRIRVSVD